MTGFVVGIGRVVNNLETIGSNQSWRLVRAMVE